MSKYRFECDKNLEGFMQGTAARALIEMSSSLIVCSLLTGFTLWSYECLSGFRDHCHGMRDAPTDTVETCQHCYSDQ